MAAQLKKYPAAFILGVFILLGKALQSLFLWLCLLVIVQVWIGLTLIQSWRKLDRLQKGPFLTGRLLEAVEENDAEGDHTGYLLTIEFDYPPQHTTYRIRESWQEPPKDHYRIWINEADPAQSAIAEDSNIRKWMLVLGTVIFVGANLWFENLIYQKMPQDRGGT